MNQRSDKTLLVIGLGVVDYGEGLRLQELAVAARLVGGIPDVLFLLEHSSVFTLGRGSEPDEILVPPATLHGLGVEVHASDRGGKATYHGPGQLVGYPILRLDGQDRDAHRYLRRLEEVLIRTVAHWGIRAERDAHGTGVWVGRRKIASLGIALKRWVAYHGFALNVAPQMRMFELIVPCGIRKGRMTSMAKLLGEPRSMDECKRVVTQEFAREFSLKPVDITLEEFFDLAQTALASEATAASHALERCQIPA